ncbi:MAG: SHOCT domain-containing protein [Chloroflexota bacterium]|nr:SHOCT domain-containing protein [Chloroflexota bacterium]
MMEQCMEMMGGSMMGGSMGGMMGAGMIMMLGMLLLWTLLIVALVLVLQRFLTGRGSSARTAAGLEILQQRYARGELDREEYERYVADLHGAHR